MNKPDLSSNTQKEAVLAALQEKIQSNAITELGLANQLQANAAYKKRLEETTTFRLYSQVGVFLLAFIVSYLNPIGYATTKLFDRSNGLVLRNGSLFNLFGEVIGWGLYLATFLFVIGIGFQIIRRKSLEGIVEPSSKQERLQEDSLVKLKALSDKLPTSDTGDMLCLLRRINTSAVINKNRGKIIEALALVASSQGTKEQSLKIYEYVKENVDNEDVHYMVLRDAAEKGSLDAAKKLHSLDAPSKASGGGLFAAGLILGVVFS
ncbi:hypothetical protein [Vibrio crassostreae]|uniref:hypothetical protein n=1 Tax=Vibrio crassostreae TaxID=246167 RepID=UPI001B3126E2|nr:hypothetical protein [Vibrio crassostreae]